jgi:cell division protein FtsN
MAAAKAPAPPTDSSAKPKNSAVDPTMLLDGPGFMLQVGAMRHKENADALEGALHRRSFSAFVLHRETDGFYRVVVGPCSDVDSTLKAKEELKGQGFESTRTRRNLFAK